MLTVPADEGPPLVCPEATGPLACFPVESAPLLARSASISLARPVSIIRAPAPTVTITAAGTPILAACQPRWGRAPAPAGRRAGREASRPAALSTDPCHARKSSSGSASGGATGALSGTDVSPLGTPGSAGGAYGSRSP